MSISMDIRMPCLVLLGTIMPALSAAAAVIVVRNANVTNVRGINNGIVNNILRTKYVHEEIIDIITIIAVGR